MLSETKQTKKDKQCGITYKWNLNKRKKVELLEAKVVAGDWVGAGGSGKRLAQGHKLPVTR